MPWAFEQVTGLAAVQGLTPPARAQFALVQANGGNVRYRLDGIAPTAAIGQELQDGGDMLTISDRIVFSTNNALFIQSSGAATLDVHYKLDDVP